jgi:hypothetical protein
LKHAVRRALTRLDFWKPAYRNPARLRQEVDGERQRLEQAAFEAGLKRDAIDDWLKWGIHDLVRADLLASAHQRTFFRFLDVLLIVPVFAVFFAGSGIALEWLAKDDASRDGVADWARTVVFALALLELVALVVILLVLVIGHQKHLHRHWIKNRYEAERIRAGRFLSLVGGNAAVLGPGEGFHAAERAHHDNSPHIGAFWKDRPAPIAQDTPIDALRCFIATAWLQHQVEYQRRTSRWHAQRHQLLGFIVEGLAVLALLVTFTHALLLMQSNASRTPELNWILFGLVVTSIFVPAAVAGVHALGNQHEHERNAARCHSIAERLHDVEVEVRKELSRTELVSLAEKAAWLAVSENQEWFDLMRFHDLELHI